jgi:hypothetical protein
VVLWVLQQQLAIGSSISNGKTQPGAAVPQHLQVFLIFSLLPIAYCLLLIAYCLLPIADSR